MNIVKLSAIALGLQLVAWCQPTTIPPGQVRGIAGPVVTILAWDVNGKFIPLRIGGNLIVTPSVGYWTLDVAPVAPGSPPERFRFTATVGQTVFTIAPSGAVRDLWVYRNGLLQGSPGDYTASVDMKTVTMVTPALAGDSVQIFAVR